MNWTPGPARCLAKQAKELAESGVQIYGSGIMHKPSAATLATDTAQRILREFAHVIDAVKAGRVE